MGASEADLSGGFHPVAFLEEDSVPTCSRSLLVAVKRASTKLPQRRCCVRFQKAPLRRRAQTTQKSTNSEQGGDAHHKFTAGRSGEKASEGVRQRRRTVCVHLRTSGCPAIGCVGVELQDVMAAHGESHQQRIYFQLFKLNRLFVDSFFPHSKRPY